MKPAHKKRRKNTIDFLPVMVEGKNSWENVVGERHRLRRSLQHETHNLFNIAYEETIRGASNPLLGKMEFHLSGSPPKQHYHLQPQYYRHETYHNELEPVPDLLHPSQLKQQTQKQHNNSLFVALNLLFYFIFISKGGVEAWRAPFS